MLLMTFATYVPEDYSLEAFEAKRLDYGLHLTPLEVWGTREHVLETVAVHNEIVRSLAAQHAGVLFVDQAKLMAGVPRYFNDPCHVEAAIGSIARRNQDRSFTAVGSSKFDQSIWKPSPELNKEIYDAALDSKSYKRL